RAVNQHDRVLGIARLDPGADDPEQADDGQQRGEEPREATAAEERQRVLVAGVLDDREAQTRHHAPPSSATATMFGARTQVLGSAALNVPSVRSTTSLAATAQLSSAARSRLAHRT